MKKKLRDCTSCHEYCRVEGKNACTKVRQREGKPSYRFLKDLIICKEYWRIIKGLTIILKYDTIE